MALRCCSTRRDGVDPASVCRFPAAAIGGSPPPPAVARGGRECGTGGLLDDGRFESRPPPYGCPSGWPRGWPSEADEERLLPRSPSGRMAPVSDRWGLGGFSTRRLLTLTLRTSPVEESLTAHRPTPPGSRGGQNFRTTPRWPLYPAERIRTSSTTAPAPSPAGGVATAPAFAPSFGALPPPASGSRGSAKSVTDRGCGDSLVGEAACPSSAALRGDVSPFVSDRPGAEDEISDASCSSPFCCSSDGCGDLPPSSLSLSGLTMLFSESGVAKSSRSGDPAPPRESAPLSVAPPGEAGGEAVAGGAPLTGWTRRLGRLEDPRPLLFRRSLADFGARGAEHPDPIAHSPLRPQPTRLAPSVQPELIADRNSRCFTAAAAVVAA
eukprot:m.48199 g.48199  ORF g.48199 m.48199 type:complete len:381 (+) comp8902_c0_seq1:381-1523(+)